MLLAVAMALVYWFGNMVVFKKVHDQYRPKAGILNAVRDTGMCIGNMPEQKEKQNRLVLNVSLTIAKYT